MCEFLADSFDSNGAAGPRHRTFPFDLVVGIADELTSSFSRNSCLSSTSSSVPDYLSSIYPSKLNISRSSLFLSQDVRHFYQPDSSSVLDDHRFSEAISPTLVSKASKRTSPSPIPNMHPHCPFSSQDTSLYALLSSPLIAYIHKRGRFHLMLVRFLRPRCKFPPT